ncbi:MAG: substrate-binding domain-containing protein, partial [Opitutaceae bacterium]|nr:substrate-binding domain-containing protein [Opitutaceae bacterium]
GFLPSERHLSELFKASRPVVHTALHLLAKENLVDIRRCRRTRLLTRGSRLASPRSRLVTIVTGEPTSQIPSAAFQGINEIRAHLAEEGYSTEILVCQYRSAKAQQRKVEAFVRQNRVACCILRSVSRELQEWFSRHSLPALVLGSCHPTAKLPSLDIDYRSVCSHAAGVFLSKGHRRLALVVPNSGLAGDLMSEEGFRDAVASRSDRGAHATIVRHNGSAEHLLAKLDELCLGPSRPTALLIARPQHTFAVIMYLLKRGLTVPDTVSVIARDYDPLFGNSIAHYPFSAPAYVHRLSRLVAQMVGNRFLAPEPSLIFPQYFPGGSVKRLA